MVCPTPSAARPPGARQDRPRPGPDRGRPRARPSAAAPTRGLALLLFLALLLLGVGRPVLALVLLTLRLVGKWRRDRPAGRARPDLGHLVVGESTAVDADAGHGAGGVLVVVIVLEEPERVGDDRQGVGSRDSKGAIHVDPAQGRWGAGDRDGHVGVV